MLSPLIFWVRNFDGVTVSSRRMAVGAGIPRAGQRIILQDTKVMAK